MGEASPRPRSDSATLTSHFDCGISLVGSGSLASMLSNAVVSCVAALKAVSSCAAANAASNRVSGFPLLALP